MTARITKEKPGVITTDYNTWLLHLHMGPLNKPLTIYPTNVKGIVTLWYSRIKLEHIPLKEAESMIGKLMIQFKGRVSL